MGAQLTKQTVELPPLASKFVEIRVTHSGVCHSDLHWLKVSPLLLLFFLLFLFESEHVDFILAQLLNVLFSLRFTFCKT